MTKVLMKKKKLQLLTIYKGLEKVEMSSKTFIHVKKIGRESKK